MTGAMTPHRTAPSDVAGLRAAIPGRVLEPGDAGYDAAREVFAGDVDARPAAIARVASPSDVAQVLEVARTTGLELAVRSGGHSAAAHSTTEGGIVLDVRDLDGLEIDAAGGTAWAGAGLTAGAYTAAAGAHGLATPFGDTGTVGLGGLTLGGGLGLLARAHGLTIDSLLAAEVVTADGAILTVDEERHPDLFWALRGGGGSLGVVTRFRFRLHRVAQVVGGLLVLPASAEVVTGFAAAAEAAPRALTTIANVMTCPPLPFVPAEQHGELVVMALLCHAGDVDAGERAVAPFRALARPIADLLQPMAYPQLFPPDEEGYRPTAVGRTLFVDRVDEAAARTIMARLRASDAPLRVAQLRVLGGAVGDVAPEATAYAHRRAGVLVNVAAFYDGEEDRAVRAGEVTAFAAALQQGDRRAYVGFLGDEGPEGVRAAYPAATWDRLAAVKARYDPGNLFRRTHHVPPAAAAPRR